MIYVLAGVIEGKEKNMWENSMKEKLVCQEQN